MSLLVEALAVAACLLAVTAGILLHRYRRDREQWRRSEEQARESGRQYRALFESSERQTQELALLERVRNSLAVELDLQPLIRNVVEAIAGTFGYARVSLYLLQDDRLVLQHQVGYDDVMETMPKDQGVMGHVIQTGQPILLDDVRTDSEFPDRTDAPASAVCIPLCDQGRTAGALNVESTRDTSLSEADLALMSALGDHIDIAIERARLYAQIRESEQRYRSVVDNVKEVIFQTDKEGRWFFLNPAWTDITGFSVEESLGTDILQYVHKDDRRQHRDFFSRLLSGRHESCRYQIRCVHNHGNVLWIEVNARVMRDSEGRSAGVFGTLDDITDQKRMEEERFRLSKLEIIAPLAGGLAHDFNNLLTGILGNATFAKMFLQSDAPDAHERMDVSLTRTEEAAMQAKNLTQQLLTFAKEGTLVTQPTSIQALIHESATFVLHGSNARCDFAIPDTLWPADIDVGQTSQVIQNLVLNAQQAMPDGGVITVRAENVVIETETALSLPPGRYVKISITDQGVGVPEDIRDKIFDPYFTTKSTGTGLGLATSYSIIQNHGGLMTLDSAVGEGSTFTLYLPASPGEAAASSEDRQAEYHSGEGRILVMDADDTVRGLVSGILTHLGYTVTLTREGGEAVARYTAAAEAGRPFDAVLMDLTVPGGMGGEEAVRHILEYDPQAKVIVSSGYSNDPVLANHREYGFTGRVVKPYRVQELSTVLHEVLAEDHAAVRQRSEDAESIEGEASC